VEHAARDDALAVGACVGVFESVLFFLRFVKCVTRQTTGRPKFFLLVSLELSLVLRHYLDL
jgi:hypothetical protein